MTKKAQKSSKKPKVSIVVPIYNVEKYLHECVDSILRQTLKDIEVILIDDGSPDRCGEIIDEYAKKDARVIAIHQENSGYSKTVNRGINISRGEYIGIIESDDFIEDDMYESLYKNAKKNKTEVTKGLFYIYHSKPTAGGIQNTLYRNPNGVDLRFAPDKVFNPTQWPRIIGFHASIWSSIYRADFIKKIKFPETAGASYQDFPFMTEVFCRAKRVSIVKRPFVHWRNDEGQGNSTSARGKKLLLMAKNSKTAIEILKKYKKFDAFKEPFFVHVLWTNYEFFNRIEWKYKKEYFKLLVEIFSEIKDDPNFHYAYFSEYENNSVRYFIERNGYLKYIYKKFLFNIKQYLIKLATLFVPTYRMARFLKDQNFDLMHQNNLMMEEILALRSEVEKLKKR